MNPPARVEDHSALPEVVEISLPATADLVALARFTAATLAAKADFDVEEIEDLRLAVDELCVMMIRLGGAGRLELRFERERDELEVSCTQAAAPGSPDHRAPMTADDGLSERILDALVDQHGSRLDGAETRVWLRKRQLRQRA
jgi:serine/threonine-protein kinase RsbW